VLQDVVMPKDFQLRENHSPRVEKVSLCAVVLDNIHFSLPQMKPNGIATTKPLNEVIGSFDQ
jgi:hypothetical protein